MLTTEQLATAVEGLTVQDAVLGFKIVDRLASTGVLGTELTPLGWFRERMKAVVNEAIGVDLDQVDPPAEKK